jgi:hypothetical protein
MLPTGLAMVAFGLLAPGAALAGSPGPLADKFFEAVKSVAPDPDEVELARYYVYEPAHAEPVYSKASGQDYVFIAILVAGKAAKNEKFPHIGVFDYNACMLPINAFDAVFSKAGEFIEKYGKEDHVKAYLHAENKEAKDKASAELAEYVPYWEDIPHICHFTFFTTLQRDKELKNTFSDRVGTMKKAYNDFADGNIVGGVDKLISVGVNGKVACTLADDIIGGGLIGKTPVLGNIAKEACAGFAGKVIGTVTDVAGYVPGQVFKGINNLGDTLAGQTKHMPVEQYYKLYWEPRVPEAVAAGKGGTWTPFVTGIWNTCRHYFDTHTMSADSARETCDYQRDKLFTPAVNAYAKTEENRADIAKKLPVWGKEFVDKWHPQCADGRCGDTILALKKSALGEGENLKQSHAADGWIYVANALESYNQSAAAEVAASKTRFTGTNQKITAQAAQGWVELFIGAWTPRCAEDSCRKDIQAMAKEMAAESTRRQAASPDESSGHVQGGVLRDYGQKAQKVVDESKRRAAIIADPKARAEDRLPWMGCKSFLGRQGEWLCEGDPGFNACVVYVKGGTATNCLNHATSGEYMPFDRMAKFLGSVGCKEQGSGREFDCPSPQGLDRCGQFKNGGWQIICKAATASTDVHPGAASRPPDNPKVSAGASPGQRMPPPIHVPVDVKAELSQKGCKSFLGREHEWLCPKGAALDACEAFKKQGKATVCHPSR